MFQMILKPEITADDCHQQYFKRIGFFEPISSAQYLDRIWNMRNFMALHSEFIDHQYHTFEKDI